jgi:hypothetical protein
MIMNGDWERIWKRWSWSFFKIKSWYSPGDNEENHHISVMTVTF